MYFLQNGLNVFVDYSLLRVEFHLRRVRRLLNHTVARFITQFSHTLTRITTGDSVVLTSSTITSSGKMVRPFK